MMVSADYARLKKAKVAFRTIDVGISSNNPKGRVPRALPVGIY